MNVSVKPRFFLFLLLMGLLVFGVVRACSVQKTAVVRSGSMGATYSAQAVIVREQHLEEREPYGRIQYIAQENAPIAQGEVIAELYIADYSEKEIARLEEARQKIREYYETNILLDVVDKPLEQINGAITEYALQVGKLVGRNERGNLLNLERQLEGAMADRQNYIRQTKKDDNRLNNLYADEDRFAASIASWCTELLAPKSGVISFYSDAYDRMLAEENIDTITAEDIQMILKGDAPDVSPQSRGKVILYRIIEPGHWYALLLMQRSEWNPSAGQNVKLTFDGVSSGQQVYDAKVRTMNRYAKQTVLRLEIHGPPPPSNQRAMNVHVGSQQQGLIVPERALFQEGGQNGVRIAGTNQYVPVQVIDRGNGEILVTPVGDEALMAGQSVIVQ